MLEVLRERRRAARQRVEKTAPMQLLMHHGIAPDKTYMATMLGVLLVAAAGIDPRAYLAAGAAAVAAAGVDAVGRRMRDGHWQLPAGSGITALIVAGILSPARPLTVAGVAAGAIALKHLFAPGGRNVFNPAALGLVLAAMVAGTGLQWWIASTPFVLLLGLLIVLWLGLEDVAFSFLAVHGGMLLLTGQGLAALQGRVGFFAFVMVVEPVTSPNRTRSRVVYGAGVALLAAALSALNPLLGRATGVLLPDTLLVALLLMNALHRILPDRWMS